MIFVTVGTFEMPFNRLLESLEKLNLEEKIIIQSGYNNFKSKKYKTVSFMNNDEFEQCINDARLVICHGGVGSILSAIKKHKKVIAIPRLEKYNEHVDDHQIEIVNKFYDSGYILKCNDEKQLQSIINSANLFEPKEYILKNNRLISFIERTIELL